MGRGGSSSKRKSSKKKTSKISSEARRKKSRRNKSKKLRRRHDSDSSYSDVESTSSSFASSSYSEDEHRSRQVRSHMRVDAKGTRKRARRSSSSQESSKDSSHVKKKKVSKRKADSEGKKRRRKKRKKSKRAASTSSGSSDSQSFSTCRSGSIRRGEERVSERLRGRSREKKKYKRDSSRVRSGTRKSRSRSMSCPSRSKLSISDRENSAENLVVDNNVRRLRSVITVPKQVEEKEDKMNNDELKEEIVYDHDDYPSSRSNDTNDGGNKRDSAHQSYFASEKKRAEDAAGEVASVSNVIFAEPTPSGKNGSNEYNGLTESSSPKEKASDASATVGLDNDSLESILRRKALENLSKFRGGLQKNAAIVPVVEKNRSDSGEKQLSTAKAAFVPNYTPDQDGSVNTGASQLAVQKSRFTWRRDPSAATQTEENIPHAKCSEIDPGTARLTGPSTTTQIEEKIPHAKYGGTDSGTAKRTGASDEKGHTTAAVVNCKSESSRSQASQLQTFPQANSSSTSTLVNKSAAEISKRVAEISNNDGVKMGDACGSTVTETPASVSAEEQSSRERQNETKDSSQFEQKTMSVMRGGEMVQVSYKVYIPKKAPALSRRQLRR